MLATNVQIEAAGDLNLLAGIGTDKTRDQYTIEARTDSFAGSAIPIDDVNASSTLVQTNSITVDTGAHLKTARDANLYAEDFGLAHMTGKAKAVNWASAAGDAINSVTGGGGAEQYDGYIHSDATGTVTVNGTIETGINRHQELIVSGMDAFGNPIISSISDGIEYTVTSQALESTLSAELAEARKAYAQYQYSNADLKAYYEAEITRIENEMLAKGLLEVVTNSDGSISKNRIDQSVITIEVAPVWAEAGIINVRSDFLLGSGTFDAPGDASITITNNSPAFLKIHGATIPESTGGLFHNGIEVTEATKTDGYTLINVAASGDPEINIINYYEPAPGVSAPTPEIQIVGDIENLNGLVNIQNDVSGGDIKITAEIRSKDLNIVAGGSVFITGLTDISTGGEPYSLWSEYSPGENLNHAGY